MTSPSTRLRVAVVAALCAAVAAVPRIATADPATNVLVVVLDDMSQRELPEVYGHLWDYGAETPPATPNIDALAFGGQALEHVTSSANCSPTRVSIHTGRYPHRYAVGVAITTDSNQSWIPLDIPDNVPRAFAEQGYRTGAFGKWHLHSWGEFTPPPFEPIKTLEFFAAPQTFGYDTYRAGTSAATTYGGPFSPGYWRIDDGLETFETEYATEVVAAEAAAWIREREDSDSPFYAVVSLNAPHKPTHVPPQESLANYLGVDASSSDRDQYVAAIEAADYYLGFLVRAVDLDSTVVVVLSDNGTPIDLGHPYADPTKLKKTVYQENLAVPCIVHAPPSVAPVAASPIEPLDIPQLMVRVFESATGATAPPTWDRFSDLTGSAGTYVELRIPNGVGPYDRHEWAVRIGDWKLLRRQGEADQVFDLGTDPQEDSPIDPSLVPVVYAQLVEALATIE